MVTFEVCELHSVCEEILYSPHNKKNTVNYLVTS